MLLDSCGVRAPWWPCRTVLTMIPGVAAGKMGTGEKRALASKPNTYRLQSPSASTGLGFWDLLAHIVEQPVPVPPPGPAVSPQLADFLTQALTKVRGR